MIGRKESCISGQIPMTDLSCLAYVLEEWTVVQYLKKYLFHVAIVSLTISAILFFFIVPLTILCFIYLSNVLLLMYQRNNEVKANPSSDAWDSARKTIARFWDIYARIWHGYELHGVENIPEGPGILVYYHGALPVDYLYFLSRLFLWKNRLCLSVADHFVFRLPGLKLLLEVMRVIPGTREECLIALKNGHLVSISPGGVREALFSDESYQLMWGNRKGFAQIALEAKVPIIPMYTQNVREGYRTLRERNFAFQTSAYFGFTNTLPVGFLRQLYENTRLPIFPPYGGLPVKLRTYVGEPIPYDPNITTEELVEKEEFMLGRTDGDLYSKFLVPARSAVRSDEVSQALSSAFGENLRGWRSHKLNACICKRLLGLGNAQTKTAIQTLISKHQTIPGSIWKALLQRFDKRRKSD